MSSADQKLHLVGVINTRGQYIRSHSTGEDLIVAVFLSEQLKAV